MPATRNRIRDLKRGGESYDELIREMLRQYDPKQALSHDE